MSKHHKAQPVATPPPSAGSLIFLAPARLRTHPKNMRRFYPIRDVRQMADSIRACKGVYQAMQVVPDKEPGYYLVVDGNMRLAGARYLGEGCPYLKCEVISGDLADQKLQMIVANTQRFDVDPISEALHYKSLKDDDGLTIVEINERTGADPVRIYNRLKLLRLDDPILTLIGEGKFTHDVRVCDALLTISDSKTRVRLVQRLAENGATIKVCLQACAKLTEQLAAPAKSNGHRAPRPASGIAPMLELAVAGEDLPAPATSGEWAQVRAAARAMCAGCDIKVEALRNQVDEPAWAIITHAANETCGACNVREVAGACAGCPGVQMMRFMIAAARRVAPEIQHVAV